MKKWLSMIICITLIVTIWPVPMKADCSTNDINEGKIIKILEIQPTDSYELSSYSDREDIEVTQMPMSMFISQREELNGQYDMIYIGMKGEIYTPFVRYTSCGGNNGNHPDFITSSSSNQSGEGINRKKKFLLNFNNNRMLGEVFPGNDITNLKSEVIMEFIESGQLVLFDDEIFSPGLEDTKLYTNFLAYKDGSYMNFYTVDGVISTVNNLLSEIANGNHIVKPKLIINSAPLDYTKDGIPTYQTDIEERWLRYSFQLQGYESHQYEGHLYLDINGDGIFKEEEKFVNLSILNPDAAIIDYMLPDTFIGMLGWKLEIVDKDTNIKTYDTGYTAFKNKDNTGDIIDIKVLQIYPNNNSKSQSKDIFDLTSLSNVDGCNLLSEDGLYNITIDRVGSKEFNSHPGELNGKYDMIIIGFSDSVSKTANINSDEALEAIKSFIETGQSLMITHDMFHFYVGDLDQGYMQFTKRFRDSMGQNIYRKDYLNNNEDNGFDWRESYPIKDGVDYYSVGFTRPHMERYYNRRSYKPSNDYSIPSYVGNSLKTTSNAYKINTGAINMFPFILHPTKDDRDLNIANTHAQYYIADLENEDLIVWYTLNSDYYDEFDARNNYYVYSLGNVTYSGTGHSSPSGKVEENKLFVNTMLKAANSANHAPIVQVSRINDNKEYYQSQKEVVFDVLVSDFDIRDMESELKIYMNSNLTDDYLQVYPSSGYRLVNNEEYIEIVLDKELLNAASEFDLKIEATDRHGAQGVKEIKGLKNIDDTRLILSQDTKWKKHEILDGDSGEMHIGLGISGDDLDRAESLEFNNVKLNISTHLEDYNDVVNSNLTISDWSKTTSSDKVYWTKNIGDLIFSKSDITHYLDGESQLFEDDSFILPFTGVTDDIKFDIEVTYERYSNNFNDQSSNHGLKVSDGIINLMVIDENDSPIGMQKIKVNGKEYTTNNDGTLMIRDLCGSGNYPIEYIYNNNVYDQATLTVEEDNGIGDIKSTISSGDGVLIGSADLNVSANPLKATIQLSYNDNIGVEFKGNINVLLKKSSNGNVIIDDQVDYAQLILDLPMDVENMEFTIDISDLLSYGYDVIPNDNLGLSGGEDVIIKKDEEVQSIALAVEKNMDNGRLTIGCNEVLAADNYTFYIPLYFKKDEGVASDIEEHKITLKEIAITPSGETEKSRINREDNLLIAYQVLEDIICFNQKPFGVFEYSGNGSFEINIGAFEDKVINNFSVKFKVLKEDGSEVSTDVQLKNIVEAAGLINPKVNDNELLIEQIPSNSGDYSVTLRAQLKGLTTQDTAQYYIIIDEINGINIRTLVDLNDEDNKLKHKIEVIEALHLE